MWSIFSKALPQPNDIGLAVYDTPVGQLTWIAAMIKLGGLFIIIKLDFFLWLRPCMKRPTRERALHRPY
jgi:hypothetical protein